MSPKFYRFGSVILLIMVANLILSACQSSNSTADQNKENLAPQVAVFAYNSEPIGNWDPALEYGNGIHFMNNVYEQLTYYDWEQKKIVPLLATEYTSSPDSLVWTFKLREGVKFHDNSIFNAQAVKFSIDRTMRLAGGASYIWDAVESINVIDDLTVEFKLKYPAPLDYVAASGYAAFIYSPTSVGSDDAWFEKGAECGTGPYKLKSQIWGDEVVIEKFDDYWGGWEGKHVSVAMIKRITETATRRQMIEKGEASIISEMPFTDVDALKSNPDVSVMVVPSLTNLNAWLSTEKPPLDNKLVRQALSYAFPYQSVIDNALGGYGVQSRGQIPVGLWGHGDDIFQYPYDLEKAKKLLEEAGYPGGGLQLLATYMAGDQQQKTTAELYKSELAKIGIELEIRAMPYDSEVEMNRSANPADRQDILFTYWWPDLPTPYSFMFSTFHSEDEPLFNHSYYKNPEVDRLMDEANAITAQDQKKAEQLYVEAQKIITEDAPSITIFDKQVNWITTKNYKGFVYNPIYPTVVLFYKTYFEE